MVAADSAQRAGRWICVGLAICLALPFALRAQTPVNPLRPANRLLPVPETHSVLADRVLAGPRELAANAEASDEIWSEPPAIVRQVVAAEEQTPEPKSVVPPQFGQPEVLPPPNLEYGLSPPGAGQAAGWPDYYVHHWFSEPWFSHSDPDDPFRHVGLGQPLMGTSWRNRPWFCGTFLGGIQMGDLLNDRVTASDTGFYGVRLGHDFDHYWGVEGRFAFAHPQLWDELGVPLSKPAQSYYGDVSLVCYPWGDSCWRPYLSAGLGIQTLQFRDEFGIRINESPLALPLGVGLKTFCNPWFTVRFDLVDNLTFGNDRVSLVNHISLMTGCEYRFGGRRTSYYPWHNNTSYW